jgi:hypothetical protein
MTVEVKVASGHVFNRRGTEFAEVFLKQKLFTPRPSRLRREFLALEGLRKLLVFT